MPCRAQSSEVRAHSHRGHPLRLRGSGVRASGGTRITPQRRQTPSPLHNTYTFHTSVRQRSGSHRVRDSSVPRDTRVGESALAAARCLRGVGELVPRASEVGRRTASAVARRACASQTQRRLPDSLTSEGEALPLRARSGQRWRWRGRDGHSTSDSTSPNGDLMAASCGVVK